MYVTISKQYYIYIDYNIPVKTVSIIIKAAMAKCL